MINERGIWLSKAETDTHLFDESLCKAIVKGLEHGMTIVDIGCGNGAYTMFIRDSGFKCIGFDGSPLTPEITNGLCSVMDFSNKVDIGKYDVVLSLEVGEHIPAEFEGIFINNLVRACRRFIILSWATEGQLGTGHVNCRNNDYVIAKFRNEGFIYCPDSTQELRDSSTLPWFKNTLLVFERSFPV